MDMGTGKTITSLALFEYSKCTNILVVCPVSKIHDWQKDVSDVGIETTILNKGTKKNITMLEDTPGLVVNFESLWRLGDELLKLINDGWFILVDESHKMKRRTSKVSKYLAKLGRRTPHKAILTGTPQSQGYIDYYSQLKFVDMLDMTVAEFTKRFCVMGPQFFNGIQINTLIGYKNTDVLDELIQNNAVFFKRTDDDLIPQHITVNIPKNKKYDKFKKDKVFKMKDGEMILGDSIGSYRMGLRQLSSGFIKSEIVDYGKAAWLEDFLDSYENRVVVFYNFNTELAVLEDVCKQQGRPISYYNGNTKDLTNFLQEPNGVALCNYKSAAESINELVAASATIFYSPTEDYILFEQSKKRTDRLGKTEKPLMYYLQSEGTLEVAIYKSLALGKNFDDKMFESYLHIET